MRPTSCLCMSLRVSLPRWYLLRPQSHVSLMCRAFISWGYQKPGHEKEVAENGSTEFIMCRVTFLHRFLSLLGFVVEIGQA